MSPWLIVIVAPSGVCVLGLAAAWLRFQYEERDRRRHIAQCELRAKADALRAELEQAEREAAEMDAFKREAELMGLFAAQLEEIQRLPEAEPWHRWHA